LLPRLAVAGGHDTSNPGLCLEFGLQPAFFRGGYSVSGSGRHWRGRVHDRRQCPLIPASSFAWRMPVDIAPADADPLPTPPEPPLASDCCGGGCDRCVYDLYDEALDRYRAELAQWQARHPGV